jgi:hypothetical protein
MRTVRQVASLIPSRTETPLTWRIRAVLADVNPESSLHTMHSREWTENPLTARIEMSQNDQGTTIWNGGLSREDPYQAGGDRVEGEIAARRHPREELCRAGSCGLRRRRRALHTAAAAGTLSGCHGGLVFFFPVSPFSFVFKTCSLPFLILLVPMESWAAASKRIIIVLKKK